MSLSASTHSLPNYREKANDREPPFQHQPSYITLSRTISRLSNNLIPLSPSTSVLHSDLTPQQQLTLRDLLSPLPYHRTKTLHTIEHARTLLLQLEQAAQNIKIQRVKKEIVRDLAEKRKAIRKLRAVVEELGKEADRREREGFPDGQEGVDYKDSETVEELLGLPPLKEANEEGGRNEKQNEEDTKPRTLAKKGQEPTSKLSIISTLPANDHSKAPTSTAASTYTSAGNKQKMTSSTSATAAATTPPPPTTFPPPHPFLPISIPIPISIPPRVQVRVQIPTPPSLHLPNPRPRNPPHPRIPHPLPPHPLPATEIPIPTPPLHPHRHRRRQPLRRAVRPLLQHQRHGRREDKDGSAETHE